MPISGKELIRKLIRDGKYKIVSTSGSHVKLRHPVTGKTLIVPNHMKDLPKGLEKSVMKDSGLKEYGGRK